MGCSTALFLARKGCRVTLYDQANQPFCGASRWNEGKIHLGYLYSGDPSMQSAEHVISGGLQFRAIVEDLLGTSIAPAITASNDIYLCHRQSIVSQNDMAAYFQRVTESVRCHQYASQYLADASQCQYEKISPAELSGLTGSADIVGGFRVPERSVDTNWLADRYLKAVDAEPAIEQSMNNRVLGVKKMTANSDGPWLVESVLSRSEPYDTVINTLWEGRMAVDQTAGIAATGVWSNRYRQSVFLTTREQVDAPCSIIATGPFGDIKNYDGRNFYLSWYPYGLRADSSAISPPDITQLRASNQFDFAQQVFDKLESFFPVVKQIRQNIETLRVEGGWVFAAGRGPLDDQAATIHRRAKFGIVQEGNYFSVDTGKYSTAPWLAKMLAQRLV